MKTENEMMTKEQENMQQNKKQKERLSPLCAVPACWAVFLAVLVHGCKEDMIKEKRQHGWEKGSERSPETDCRC